MADLQPTDKDLAAIQGLVARGYARMKTVCHFVLQVKDPVRAKAFLADLIERRQITTAEEWGVDPMSWPKSCLNIGFTFKGLAAFGLKDACDRLNAKTELEAFVKGAVGRAERIGDLGRSSPETWIGGLSDADRVHVLLSVYAADETTLQKRREELQGAFQDGLTELSAHIGKALNERNDLIHFGYRDGIAQPNVAGLPARKNSKDGEQPVSPAGAFLLGYPSQFPGHTYDFDFPSELARNGTFAAFRILEQDVAEFEKFLEDEAKNRELDAERVAAMICGRARDGKPMIEPDSKEETINDFSYGDDLQGQACPFSAHIRRANPRDDKIAGNVGSQHRIIRRGMPYGEPFNSKMPDNQPRGLLGLFICVSLRDQFEFIMRNWINRGGFQGHLPAVNTDPLTANRFVYTKGGAYLFLPSIDGLKYIAIH